ncbi:ATP-grasp domain-containing protein [Streptomyces klenkii]|uniref:ATP-grasp domain-containing protein n=1 Tax=Streptomyces klenkii TaxID=1420899 RepID=UPI003404A7D1
MAVSRTDFLAHAPQYSTTGELLAAAARQRGMDVEVLPVCGGAGGLRGRPGGHYFGGPLFAAGIADELEVGLLEPTDDWLSSLPHEFTLRNIVSSTLSEARRLTRPAFVKPPSGKSFPAAVHTDGGTLPRTTDLPSDTPVQISDVVTWAREFRLFVLDRECRTGSQYVAFGRMDSAPLHGHPDEEIVREFANNLLAAHGHTLPSAVALDVGLLSTSDGGTSGWAVVEANMAWFANCYASDPDRTLDVVLRAAGPRSRLSARDRGFCRHLKDA